MKPMIIFIAGGSGSGKTTLAKRFRESLGEGQSKLLLLDNYYHDQSDKFDRDGGSVNFDHPDSIDNKLLATHLKKLSQGESVDLPLYDFATHSRLEETQRLSPAPYIIVDGILILHYANLLDLADFKIYVSTKESVRLERRMKRDIVERGRTEQGVLDQFWAQVKPMHDEFVSPSKENANLVLVDNELEVHLHNVLDYLRQNYSPEYSNIST